MLLIYLTFLIYIYSNYFSKIGYSGSDIKLVCKEAAMIPVRKIFNILENMNEEESAKLTQNNLENGHESHINIKGNFIIIIIIIINYIYQL